MAEISTDLDNVIAQFSKLQISDGSTGVIKKRFNEDNWLCFPKPSKKCEYFGLSLPEGAQGEPKVFKSLKDALSHMKTNKGSRFKSFPTEEEAFKYAATPLRVQPSIPKTQPESSPPSVTPQTYVKFRRHIEKGGMKAVMDMLWTTPRLMISRGDTPAILHEGTRMNALHVCAKTDESSICKLLLDILECNEFMKKLYPSEKSDTVLRDTTNKLLDFFLNTPDKTLGDTPLHYASKFGSIKCLRIFLSHPLSCTTLKNIDGKTPKEIVGSRCKDDGELFSELKKAFDDLYYVSVLRSHGSSPTLAKPLKRKNFILKEGSALPELNFGPGSIKNVKAFAGPMDKELAERFYQILKYPSSCLSYEESRVIHEVRVSDSVKGLERTTRLLAHDFNVNYLEHFPFLNLFANLSSSSGLQALENHLKGVVNVLPSSPEEFIFATSIHPMAEDNPLGHDINVHLMRENRRFSEETEPEFFTPPSSPEFHLAPSSPSFTSKNHKYIQLSKFTRLDVDVLIAVGDTYVDEEKYPEVSKWKKNIDKKLKESENKQEERKNITPLASVPLPRLKDSDVRTPPSRTPRRRINTCGRNLFKDFGLSDT